MKRVYIRPEMEVINLNTTDDVLMDLDDTVSTQDQLGNQGQFEEEEDEFDDFSDEF